MNEIQSSEHLYALFGRIVDQIRLNPSKIDAFTHSNLVVRVRLTAPEAEIMIDGRQPPLEVYFGERPGTADFEMSLTAPHLLRLLKNEDEWHSAIFSGQIQIKGNVLRASSFIEFLLECQSIYGAMVSSNSGAGN